MGEYVMLPKWKLKNAHAYIKLQKKGNNTSLKYMSKLNTECGKLH